MFPLWNTVPGLQILSLEACPETEGLLDKYYKKFHYYGMWTEPGRPDFGCPTIDFGNRMDRALSICVDRASCPDLATLFNRISQ